MKVEHINPFLSAIQDIFQKMVHIPLCLGKPYVKDPRPSFEKIWKVGVVVEMTGAVSGLLVLKLSESAAKSLASGLAGDTFDGLDANCYDALCEIANMIAGNAKKDLAGQQVTISTPKLMPAHEVVYPAKVVFINIPFDTPNGRFQMEVGFRRVRSKPASEAA